MQLQCVQFVSNIIPKHPIARLTKNPRLDGKAQHTGVLDLGLRYLSSMQPKQVGLQEKVSLVVQRSARLYEVKGIPVVEVEV